MSNEAERIAMLVAQKLIANHEGYRSKIYLDTEGVPTGGVGHAFLVGSELPEYIWNLIYEEDFKDARTDAADLMNSMAIPNPGLGRTVVLIDMCFNLGKVKLSKFAKMWAALKVGDYNKAATEMLDSKWAKQVGIRAITLSNIMRTGGLPNVK